jgi:O-acetyl-ADP-ribose deacetylase
MPDISGKQFTVRLYPNTEIRVGMKDLLSAPTDTIVNPANSGLSHGGGLAATIAKAAGDIMEEDCEKIIQKHGRVPKTIAVPTRAGNLPYKCIIHAVGPRMGDGDEYGKLTRTIFNTMKVCFKMNLKSVAFPAISTGIFAVPKEICAKAFIEALRQFWSEDEHRKINLVWVCLTLNDFPYFEKVMGTRRE